MKKLSSTESEKMKKCVVYKKNRVCTLDEVLVRTRQSYFCALNDILVRNKSSIY